MNTGYPYEVQKTCANLGGFGTGYITSNKDTLKPHLRHFCNFGPSGSPKSHDWCNVWPQNDSSTRSHVKHPCVTSLDRPPGSGSSEENLIFV